MKYLDNQQISEVSFPDAPVTEFTLNSERNEINFKSDVYVGSAPSGRWFDDCIIAIRGFDKISIIKEDTQIVTNYASEYALREICEFEYTSETITMRGFTVGRGLWTEFKVFNGMMSIGYDESHQNSE